jgi:tetratricopeptide (TPR) repeat protein
MIISSRGEALKGCAGVQPAAAIGQSAGIRRSTLVRWALVALLAAVFGLVSNGKAQAQLTVKNLLSKSVTDATDDQFPDVKDAIERFTNSDVKGAYNSLSQAKSKNPTLPPADMLMAQLWMAAKQAGQAQGSLEECVKNNPNDPEAYLALGEIAFGDHHVEAADLLLNKAEQLAATFKENQKRAADFKARAEAGLAMVAESRQEWDTAEKYLHNWIKLVDPTPTDRPLTGNEVNTQGALAHLRLGQVLFHANPDKRAGAAAAYPEFVQAQKEDPSAVAPYIALAMLFEDAKDHKQAQEFITRAVSHPSSDPVAQEKTLLDAARWALTTNQADEAYNDAKAAYDLNPKSKRALEAKLTMGIAARMKGDVKNAEQNLEDVYVANPGNFEASNQLAQTLVEENDPEKKERGLQVAVNNEAGSQGEAGRQNPSRAVESAATLGWALFQLDRIKEADQVTQAVINSHAGNPDIFYFQARLFQDGHGQTKEAIAELRQALNIGRGPFIHKDDAQQMLSKLDRTYNPNAGTPPATSSTSAPAGGAPATSDATKTTTSK